MKTDLPERSFAFARRVVLLCRGLDERPGVPRTLASQLLRSGTSIGANVEEAQASQSTADFISKYSIACKEARETHYWLRLLDASDLLPGVEMTGHMANIDELVRLLTAITRSVKESLTQ